MAKKASVKTQRTPQRMRPYKVRAWTNAQRERIASAFQVAAVGVFLLLLREYSLKMLIACVAGSLALLYIAWYIASFTRDPQRDNGG